MAFYQKSTPFDLGELNIENIFISDFMPSASGTYVKVYLLGLMFSRSETDAYRLDNRSLASMLSLPLQDILEAWAYWEKQGIVLRHFHSDGQHFDIEFLSLRDLYIQNNYTLKGDSSKVKSNKTAISERNEAYKKMTKSVEQLVGHPLSYAEYQMLGDFYDHYYSNSEIITRAVAICYKERHIRNMKAVKALLNSWLEAQLMSLDAIEAHIRNSDARFKVYKEVLKHLGLSYRMVNSAEKQMIDRWIDDYGFETEDLYALIIAFAKKTNNLNLNYLQKAFETLHKEGIKDLKGYEERRTEAATDKRPSDKKKRFTIEKERHYSEEELEALLLKKK